MTDYEIKELSALNRRKIQFILHLISSDLLVLAVIAERAPGRTMLRLMKGANLIGILRWLLDPSRRVLSRGPFLRWRSLGRTVGPFLLRFALSSTFRLPFTLVIGLTVLGDGLFSSL